MTIDELANSEMELYSRVISQRGTMDEKSDQLQRLGIYDEYKKIHQEYAKLNKGDLEALKRGLFIIWYSVSEPSCFTGIRNLDSDAEEKIIKTLNRRIKGNITDYELDWMLGYYSNWDYAFERFYQYEEFQKRLSIGSEVEMPDEIDRKEMENRGQMGIYWNSLTIFKKQKSS